MTIKTVLMVYVLVGIAFGQVPPQSRPIHKLCEGSVVIKDIDGLDILVVKPTTSSSTDIKQLFYYDDVHHLVFRADLVNVARKDLVGVSLLGRLATKDSTQTFKPMVRHYPKDAAFYSAKDLTWDELPEMIGDAASLEIGHVFEQPTEKDDIVSLTFSLEDPKRTQQLTDERAQQLYEESKAELAKEKAAEAVRAAKERRVRANCRAVYTSTIDKKTGDLTVRETELVKACQALGLYPPE